MLVDLDELHGELARLVGALGWQRDALCLEYEHVEFFPAKDESAAPARAVCARCLVAEECRGYAAAAKIKAGVWGGVRLDGRDPRPVVRRGPRRHCTGCGGGLPHGREKALCVACETAAEAA